MHSRRQDPRYLWVLSLAAVVILVGGWLVRPRTTPQAPAALPTEADLAVMARRAERRSLEGMTGYFAGVANDVAAAIVRVPELGASGIVWTPRQIVTARLPEAIAPASVRVVAGAETRETHPERWGPNLPLAALASDPGDHWQPPAPALSPPAVGAWVVAVWRGEDAPAFTAGHYVQRGSLQCDLMTGHELISSVPLTPAMTGGGLFNLDGQLLAVILPCGERFAAVAAVSIADVLAHSATAAEAIEERLGLVVSTPGAEEVRYLGVEHGAIVRDVRLRQAGDLAGFAAGDLIVRVNSTEVAAVEDLSPLLEASGEVTVRRAGRPVVIPWPPRPGRGAEEAPRADAGVVLTSAMSGFAIDAVVAGSRAARAGLAPGDRIVRIDSAEPRSLDDIRRRLRARRDAPVLIEVERGGRRTARWLPPEDARE